MEYITDSSIVSLGLLIACIGLTLMILAIIGGEKGLKIFNGFERILAFFFAIPILVFGILFMKSSNEERLLNVAILEGATLQLAQTDQDLIDVKGYAINDEKGKNQRFFEVSYLRDGKATVGYAECTVILEAEYNVNIKDCKILK